jgi:arylsulfatase A-like enzyme
MPSAMNASIRRAARSVLTPIRSERLFIRRGLAWRCLLLLTVLISVVRVAAASPENSIPPPQTRKTPNILFILADDLGYGDLGCYGQKKVHTPNIDRLAAEGMRFTQFYAGSTVCAPSRACLMTGLHTGHARIRGNERVPLESTDVTIGKVLKQAGYVTAAIGKWGMGNEGTSGHPNLQGFDEWFGYLDQVHAHNYYPASLWRNDHALSLEGNQNGGRSEYSHDLFTREAVSFLRLNKDRPFFLYLAFTIPHANNERKDQGMEVPDNSPYGAEDWPPAEKNKAAMITRLDRDIGRIMAELRANGLDRNTIIFFSSDNGPHKEGGVDPRFLNSAGPLRGIKRDLYEGGIRVPMIVCWPGRIPAGSVNETPWAFWDFLPTAAALASVSTPDGIDGISFVPLLLGAPQPRQHELFYWEFHEGFTKQAARWGKWKAVRLAPGRPVELYDLNSDPGETKDVSGLNPDIAGKLSSYLDTARTPNPHWPIKGPKDDPTP